MCNNKTSSSSAYELVKAIRLDTDKYKKCTYETMEDTFKKAFEGITFGHAPALTSTTPAKKAKK